MKDNFDDTDFREVVSDSGETEEHTESEPGDSSDGKEGNSAVDSQDSAESEYEDICYICHRPESKAGKMIKIPNEICICADCMQKTFDSMNHGGFPLGDMSNFGNMPNISMINLSDLQNMGMNMVPRSQKLKKKKSKEEKKEKPVLDIKPIPAPHRIKASLDEYVVGQEHAKKVMSVAVYNHYKRVACDNLDGVEIEKSNMLMVGPTGSGKTYMVRTLAKLLDVPLAIADATSLTEAGYIGDDIESVVSKLLAAADNDVEKAEHGIIFIDEIDKIAKKKNTHQRDVSGESVQQGMLKLLEGAEIEVPVGANSKNAMVPLATVNTRNILFICGGAFDGIEKKIAARMNSMVVGFNASQASEKIDRENFLQYIAPQDLKSFGLIPEIIGRLPVLTYLEPLDRQALRNILTEPKNAIIRQYIKLFELDGITLQFDESVYEFIVDKAIEFRLGARGLRSICEAIMTDLMFEIPSQNKKSVTITKAYAEEKLSRIQAQKLRA